jgi:hypothetical protein
VVDLVHQLLKIGAYLFIYFYFLFFISASFLKSNERGNHRHESLLRCEENE